MNLEEAIAREDALAYSFGERWKRLGEKIETLPILEEEHRQMADWLRELKERRIIQNILLQFLVDDEYDICCDELAEDEEEWEICEKTCNNHTKECWIRWAKMKAREVNANDD